MPVIIWRLQCPLIRKVEAAQAASSLQYMAAALVVLFFQNIFSSHEGYPYQEILEWIIIYWHNHAVLFGFHD